MLSSKALKDLVAQARPIIERQLDDAERIAGFRNVVASNGGDWSALKALIKAQIQDERDETGDGKRVKKILDKASFSTDYAELLGWSNVNEKNFSSEDAYDPETGEILEGEANAKLISTVVTGMQTEIGRKALLDAVDIMIAREEQAETTENAGAAGRPDSDITETHERPSIHDEPSPEAVLQDEASPAGTGAGTLADREGRSDGEAVKLTELPTNQLETIEGLDVDATVEQRSSAPFPDVVPAFLAKQPNERCARPGDCRFDHHPQKITCADCTSAYWRKTREVA